MAKGRAEDWTNITKAATRTKPTRPKTTRPKTTRRKAGIRKRGTSKPTAAARAEEPEKTLSVRVPKSLRDRLDKLASDLRTTKGKPATMAGLVIQAVEALLKKHGA